MWLNIDRFVGHMDQSYVSGQQADMQLHVYQGEEFTDTPPRAQGERVVDVPVTLFDFFIGKSLGLEFIRLFPESCIPVHQIGTKKYIGASWNLNLTGFLLQLVSLDGFAGKQPHRRVESERFINHLTGVAQR